MIPHNQSLQTTRSVVSAKDTLSDAKGSISSSIKLQSEFLKEIFLQDIDEVEGDTDTLLLLRSVQTVHDLVELHRAGESVHNITLFVHNVDTLFRLFFIVVIFHDQIVLICRLLDHWFCGIPRL